MRQFFKALAGLAAGVGLSAQAQQFSLEFWPPVPDRTRQVAHWISCPVGASLVFTKPALPAGEAVVGGFVFVSKGAPAFLGLYKIVAIKGQQQADASWRNVTISAICTTGLS